MGYCPGEENLSLSNPALVGVNLQSPLSVARAPTAAPTSWAGKLAGIPW